MSIATEIARLQGAKADLKTAINAKGGTIDTEPLDEYSGFVDDLEVGGGGEPIADGDFLVEFFDFDGTVIKSEWVDYGGDATLPETPTHTDEGLIFDEWNHSHENITRQTQIGAIYKTADEKTHLWITLDLITGLEVTLNFSYNTGGDITINWGDGSATDKYTADTNVHTYSNYGDYIIKLLPHDATFGDYLQPGGASACIAPATCLLKYYEGVAVNGTYSYSFNGCTTLKYYVDAKFGESGAGLSGGNYGTTFYNCYSLVHINVAKTSTTYPFLGINFFANCHSLKNIVFADTGVVRFYGNYIFNGCSSLEKLIFPLGSSQSQDDGYNLFTECFSLKKIIGEYSALCTYNQHYNCYSLLDVGDWDIKTGTALAGSLLYGCHNLKKITIKRQVTAIGSTYNFRYCYSCGFYILERNIALTTLAATNAFTNTAAYKRIYVPDHLVDSYKGATNWSTYAAYIYSLSDLDGYYNVTFDSQGGSAVVGQTWATGELLDEPTDPTLADYVFSGWFTEAECTTEWTFATDTMPASALTLYAKWVAA